MYRIDADTHINSPEVRQGIRVEELLSRMDYAIIDKSLVWLQPPYDGNIPHENEYIHDCVKIHTDRLLGFGWTDPHMGLRGAA